MVQSVQAVLRVDPQQGDDSATGEPTAPVKTLSQALRLAVAGTVIRLSEGIYTVETGEEFPLRVPAGVTLVGNVGNRGSAVVIVGSGPIDSINFGQQTVALLLEATAQLRGITVTNPAPQGTGIWIESAQSSLQLSLQPIVAHCTIARCEREGIFVSGTALPAITNCLLQGNRASGIAFVRYAKGEVRRCVLLENHFGMVLSDRAAPLLVDNQVHHNRIGIALSGAAHPVLRHNVIEHNSRAGLAVFGVAQPDLGNPQAPASNQFKDNQAADLANHTSTPLNSVGNQLNPLQVRGAINFQRVASAIPPAPRSLEATVPHSPPPRFPHTPTSPISHSRFAALLSKALPNPISYSAAETADLPLTRLQAIVLLCQALGLTAGNPALLDIYRDRAQIPSEFALWVAAATQHRLVVLFPPVGGGAFPKENRLQPLQPLTEAEAAAMLHQALVMQGKAPAIDDPWIVQPSPANVAFADVQGHWAASFIQGLASRGAIAGDRRGIFAADQPMSGGDYSQLLTWLFSTAPTVELSPLSRLQMWQSLLEGLASNGLALPSVDLTLLNRYKDAANLPTEAQVTIAQATQLRLVANAPQLRQLRPHETATRSEIAVVIWQAGILLGRCAPIASPFLIDPDRPAQPQPRLKMPHCVLLKLGAAEGVQAIAQALTNLLQQQAIEVLQLPDAPPTLAAGQTAIQLEITTADSDVQNQSGVAVFYPTGAIDSARLAHRLHKTILQILDAPSRGVQAYPAEALPPIATARIEVGILSHPTDSRNLAEPEYCKSMAEAITQGVLQVLGKQVFLA
ncbi:DUF1565 domain-containing protein [Phormidium tenue FACHB-886]|nr:DUF1565 domain-containing protein [Phormidium tenue FACHB-886]